MSMHAEASPIQPAAGRAGPHASAAVLIIIVNWNRRADILRCLASLEFAAQAVADILVVDNASTDDSVAAIRTHFPDVQLIENACNAGFAEGNNIGLRWVLEHGYEYVLLLNNDTVAHPELMATLHAFMQAHPEAAAVGPAIYYLGQPGLLWSAGGRLDARGGRVSNDFADTPVARLPAQPYAVDHLSGCCMLVRSAAIRRAGLLDPDFFMYFEETEWCVRLRRAGYSLWIEPRATVWHDVQPGRHLSSRAVAYYMTRNQLLFLRRTQAPRSAWAATLTRQLRTVVSLYLKPRSLQRARGRGPMVLALRDFALGRYGPQRIQ